MIRGTPCLLALLAGGLLAGCGGGTTPGDIAAQACDAQVQTQLAGRPYTLDLGMLAASIADDGRGSHLLKAAITVNAGLADQQVQELECTVRLAGDGTSADVMTVRFIW